MTAPDSAIDAIFAHVDANQQRYLARLLDYLRLPSISAEGIGMDAVADTLLDHLQRLGFDARLLPTAGWPMVFGAWRKLPGAPTVLLYGHYDVQPADPPEAWVSPPFAPTIRNGRIYARGAGDNKGQHFAQLLALEATLAVHGALPCNVLVLLEGEEEVGSPHIADLVRQQRDLLRCDLVVTADGPVHESGRATVMFGVRGVASFELRAHGANRDLHSGNWGGVAPNPLWTLVHLLATMKAPDGTITIDGFYENVQSLSGLEQAALATLPVDVTHVKQELGLAVLDAPGARGYYARLAAWPTLTINGLHGGYGGPGSKTVLPCEAFAKCDIRLVAAQTVTEIFNKVAAHVHKHAPDVEFVPQGGMDPSKTPLDSPFAAPVCNAVARGFGEEPLRVPAMGGSLPDYVWTQILGVPSFVTPYANADEANHAPNENLEVERFFKGIKTGAALLVEIGKTGAAQ